MNNAILLTKKKLNILQPIINSLCKKIVIKKLGTLKHGSLILTHNKKKFYFGQTKDTPPALINIHHPTFFNRVVLKGHTGFADSYANNEFSTPNLTKLLTLFANNLTTTDKAERGLTWIFNTMQVIYYHLFEKNNLKGSKRNIHAHYNLGNHLFKTFLDKNMQYSSAVYKDPHLTLDEAQIIKMQTICQQLQLSHRDHLLEIGTGWGGLSIYIAKTIGCKITTITISQEQYNYAKERIQQENLSDLITIKLQDYREINGLYDKIVSIEMIEAVGHQYYQDYFNICQKLMKKQGLFLIQAILIADHQYKKAKNSVDFIKRYIFPGSNIPSLNQLNLCANRANMCLVKYTDITESYVKTLSSWQNKFNEENQKLLKLGYDHYFQKIWNFYFSYCQAGFQVEHIRDAHLIFKKK